jgi:hypothetical protein
VHVPETQRAGGMQLDDDPHDAPSAAAGEQVPPIAALHVPLPGQTAYEDATIEFAPQLPVAIVSARQEPLEVLQPTPLARSHSL